MNTLADYTIKRCVVDWLTSGVHGLEDETISEYEGQARKWVYPRIGERPLGEFSASEAQEFFNGIAPSPGKRSLQMIKSTLRRSIKHAQVNDLIGRNVIELVTLPQGRPGRPSRAVTERQAEKLFAAAAGNGWSTRSRRRLRSPYGLVNSAACAGSTWSRGITADGCR